MYISPFAYLFNKYEHDKNSVVEEAFNMLGNKQEGYKKHNLICIKPEYIKAIESNKISLPDSNYINCVEYIDKIYEQESNYIVRKYFYERLKSFLITIQQLLFNDGIMDNILGILYKHNGKMVNLCHPLTILQFLYMKEISFESNDFIIISYPQEYKELNPQNTELENMFYDNMLKTIKHINDGMLSNEDKDKTDNSIYIDFDKFYILKKNSIENSVVIFPVDKMSAVSLVPFYGWNYAVFKNNKFVGDSLVSYVNKTGNISKNTYCTGKLSADIEGLEALRGCNLSSAYTKYCIDINNNHSWIKANMRVTKFLLDKGLKDEHA